MVVPDTIHHSGRRIPWSLPPVLAGLAYGLWTAFVARCRLHRRCRSSPLLVPPPSSIAAVAIGHRSGAQASGPPTPAGSIHAGFTRPSSWAQWLSHLGFLCSTYSPSSLVMRFYFLVAHSRENVYHAAFTRLSVSCIPIYVNRTSDEGWSKARHLSDCASEQRSGVYQRHANQIFERFPSQVRSRVYSSGP